MRLPTNLPQHNIESDNYNSVPANYIGVNSITGDQQGVVTPIDKATGVKLRLKNTERSRVKVLGIQIS